MAYSVITSPVTGTTISTTTFGQLVKDNFDAAFPLGVDGWTSWTPTLTQSSAVTKTVSYAKYQRVGRLIVAQLHLAVTGAGTANNIVTVSLPVTGAFGGSMATGAGYITDASAAANYGGIAVLVTGTTAGLIPTSADVANLLGGTGMPFAAALASGDSVSMQITYESAA